MENDQLHRELLELIEAEKAALKKRLDAFYNSDDQSVERYYEINEELLASLERIFKIYNDNDGKESLFLTNTLKPLRDTYDNAKQFKTMVDEGSHEEAESFDGKTVPEDRQVVHITLYMAGGHELSRWEQQLRSLNKLIQSRPVYDSEEAAQKVVRGQMSLNTEGYVSVAVKKNAVLPNTSRKDRHGRPLVTLVEGAIDDPEFILQFVLGGKYYRFINGKLVHTIPGKAGLYR